jgi:TonB-linked SusC/RagA family outer membrane protein
MRNHSKDLVGMRWSAYFIMLLFVLLAVDAMAQGSRTISGSVTDQQGEALIGVNVVLKGTTSGTITDFDGKFSMPGVNQNSILEFSYLGYTKVSRTVGTAQVINITMEEDRKTLDEVLVVGYASQTKATVTGAINSVKSEELLKTPVANISNALAGRTSGLTAIQRSGEPGRDQSTLRIRGIATLNSGEQAEPLVLVDGVERNFNEIDPNEIETINILKDASATAVFGVRGANGVILVTTKIGREGKPNVSYTSNFAYQNPTRLPKSVTSPEYAQLYNEAWANDGNTEKIFSDEDIRLFGTGESPYTHPNNDWYDLMIKPLSFQQQHNINVGGGAKNTRYFVSLGYFQQEGAYREAQLYKDINGNPNYSRFNFRSNLDFKLGDKTEISMKIGSQVVDARYPGVDTGALFGSVLSAAPISTPGIVDGKLIKSIEGGTKMVSENPFYSIIGLGWRDIYNNNLNANLSFRQNLSDLVKGLTARGMISYDGFYSHTLNRKKEVEEYIMRKNIWSTDPDELAANPFIFELARQAGPISTSESWGKNHKIYGEAALEFDRKFELHQVTGLVLANFQKFYAPSLRFGLPAGYAGLVGRVTYNYAHRYLAEINMGYNGSENFPAGKRFGFFPAFSLGWTASEETFFPKSDFFSYMKIRASYGEVGNDKLGNYRYLYRPSVYSLAGRYFLGEEQSVGNPRSPFTYVEQEIGNPNVTWERARKSNVGMELKFLNDKLSMTLDGFYEYRDQILWQREDQTVLVQARLQPTNIGIVSNRGLELEMGYDDKIGDFKYGIRGNFSWSKNRIEYKSESPKPFDNLYETGNSVGQYKGLIFEGFYNTWDEINDPARPRSSWEGNGLKPGDAKYRDIAGDPATGGPDGKIDENDYSNIGFTPFPAINYGVNLNLAWKSLEFSVLFQGVGQVSTYFAGSAAYPFYSGFRTAFTWHKERWTEERYLNGEVISYPRLTTSASPNLHNYRMSTLWLQDASYIRVKNIEMAYRFKSVDLKVVKLNSMRVFVNAQNLFTFTKMRYFDPEAPAGQGTFYPQMRVFNAGLSVQL